MRPEAEVRSRNQDAGDCTHSPEQMVNQQLLVNIISSYYAHSAVCWALNKATEVKTWH